MEPNMRDWCKSFVDRLLGAKIASLETIKGCSEKELLEIENRFGLSLPESYRCYMGKLGKRSGDFLSECGMFFPDLLLNRERATTLLENNSDFRLKESDFVFLERYGYQFFYFETSDGSVNPPVFRYTELSPKPILLANSFTEAMDLALGEYLTIMENPMAAMVSRFTD
jgi:hypothetical protein